MVQRGDLRRAFHERVSFCRHRMSILILIFVVIVLLVLALYIVNLIPIPQPPFAKPLLMILCAAIAFFVIAERSGLLR